jgi:FAD synthetase
MKKVMVFGTFDIFHKGHENFLKQARRKGDFLLVVVARDKTVAKIKKQKTRNKEQKRKRILENSHLVDKVILGNLGDKYAIIKKYQPDIIYLGYDQKAYVDKIKDKLLEYGLEKTKIIRLKPFHPEKYKSSKLSFRA